MDRAGIESKVEEILREILAAEVLQPAAAVREGSAQELAGLREAHAALMRRAKELVEAQATAAARAEEAVIAAARSQWREAAWSSLAAQAAAVESEQRMITRANRRLLEHLLPAAEAASLEGMALECEAQGVAIQQASSERMQKTAELIASAAAHEGEIVFDPRRTLSGLLEARAQALFAQAEEHRRRARERRERHAAILRGARPAG